MIVFDDIALLDDRSVQKILREVDSQELAKALNDAGFEVSNKIFSVISKRAATMLKEDMEYIGPLMLEEIAKARQKIISIICHLRDCGEIVIDHPETGR
jgi:flagellar motor switch protein FliG